MLLGTCRVHDPTVVIRERYRLPVRRTLHRLHTPMQTLQFVRYMCGKDSPYTPGNVHLLSDHATADILLGRRDAADIIADLQQLRADWPRFECFLVEISSLREHWIATPDGGRFYVNTFCRRDLELHAERVEAMIATGRIDPIRSSDIQLEMLTQSQLLDAMREIGDLLAKPVLWISHMRPGSDAPEFETVNKVRSHLSNALSANAVRLGHRFFDPSSQVAAHGRDQFLAKKGADLDHLSEFGTQQLAGIYRDFVVSC